MKGVSQINLLALNHTLIQKAGEILHDFSYNEGKYDQEGTEHVKPY